MITMLIDEALTTDVVGMRIRSHINKIAHTVAGNNSGAGKFFGKLLNAYSSGDKSKYFNFLEIVDGIIAGMDQRECSLVAGNGSVWPIINKAVVEYDKRYKVEEEPQETREDVLRKLARTIISTVKRNADHKSTNRVKKFFASLVSDNELFKSFMYKFKEEFQGKDVNDLMAIWNNRGDVLKSLFEKYYSEFSEHYPEAVKKSNTYVNAVRPRKFGESLNHYAYYLTDRAPLSKLSDAHWKLLFNTAQLAIIFKQNPVVYLNNMSKLMYSNPNSIKRWVRKYPDVTSLHGAIVNWADEGLWEGGFSGARDKNDSLYR